jgi:hypothetical protein
LIFSSYNFKLSSSRLSYKAQGGSVLTYDALKQLIRDRRVERLDEADAARATRLRGFEQLVPETEQKAGSARIAEGQPAGS